MNILRTAWRRGRSLLPMEGFAFGRPLVVLQSDDWGRVGLRDREAWQELQDRRMNLGERAYDFYSLETAEDVAAIVALLLGRFSAALRHRLWAMVFVALLILPLAIFLSSRETT